MAPCCISQVSIGTTTDVKAFLFTLIDSAKAKKVRLCSDNVVQITIGYEQHRQICKHILMAEPDGKFHIQHSIFRFGKKQLSLSGKYFFYVTPDVVTRVI